MRYRPLDTSDSFRLLRRIVMPGSNSSKSNASTKSSELVWPIEMANNVIEETHQGLRLNLGNDVTANQTIDPFSFSGKQRSSTGKRP